MTKLRCDICEADVTEKIEIETSQGKKKVKNIGKIAHTRDGKKIVRCRKCHKILNKKGRKKRSSYKLIKDYS